MVLKEMDFRDTRDSFLILTPAQLAPSGSTNYRRSSISISSVIMIMTSLVSIATIRSSPASTQQNQRQIGEDVLSRRWDVVVLDEAHYVRVRIRIGMHSLTTSIMVRHSLRLQRRSERHFRPIQHYRPHSSGNARHTGSSSIIAMSSIVTMRKSNVVTNCNQKLNRVMIRNRRREDDSRLY